MQEIQKVTRQSFSFLGRGIFAVMASLAMSIMAIAAPLGLTMSAGLNGILKAAFMVNE